MLTLSTDELMSNINTWLACQNKNASYWSISSYRKEGLKY